MYNSRLIGGSIRLRQQRINWNGDKDTETYDPGWTEHIVTNNNTTSTPWRYSKSNTNGFFIFSKIINHDIISIIINSYNNIN